MQIPRIEPADEHLVKWVAHDLHPLSKAELEAIHGLDVDFVDVLIRQYAGRGEVVFDRFGHPACLYALIRATPGTITTAFVATTRFKNVALPFARYVKRLVWPGVWATGAHRIQSTTIGSELPELFGMEAEAGWRGFGANGEDVTTFAIMHPNWYSADARMMRNSGDRTLTELQAS